MFGYSKNMDDSSINSVEHDRKMFNRITSCNPAISHPERAKVTAELAIMRSSIDPLPEINVRLFMIILGLTGIFFFIVLLFFIYLYRILHPLISKEITGMGMGITNSGFATLLVEVLDRLTKKIPDKQK